MLLHFGTLGCIDEESIPSLAVEEDARLRVDSSIGMSRGETFMLGSTEVPCCTYLGASIVETTPLLGFIVGALLVPVEFIPLFLATIALARVVT